jgi:hypothetical protein
MPSAARPSPITQESLASAIRALPPGVRPSDAWRAAAVALLRIASKEPQELARLFQDERTTDEKRMLVLDLFAAAGTYDLQVVMRRLLDLAVARRDSRTFAAMVQRLASVERPDGPTLRFLMSVYAESKNAAPDVRASCAYALGAAAGRARVDPEGEEVALRASDVLRRDLRAASTPAERCPLLTALGNAGIPSDVEILVRYASDADPSVRSAAALGLRKMTTREARSQLVALLGDGEATVAHNAISALADAQLDDEELDRLAELVLAGRTTPSLDARILALVVAQRPRMERTSRVRPLEHALRMLLARLDGASKDPSSSGERAVAAPRVPSASGIAAAPRNDDRPTLPPAPPAPVHPMAHESPPPVGPLAHPVQALPYSGAYSLVDVEPTFDPTKPQLFARRAKA